MRRFAPLAAALVLAGAGASPAHARTVKCADVSIDAPGPTGEAGADMIRAMNVSCRTARRTARYVLCHDGRPPRGWQPIGGRRIALYGARNGRWVVRWRLSGGTTC